MKHSFRKALLLGWTMVCGMNLTAQTHRATTTMAVSYPIDQYEEPRIQGEQPDAAEWAKLPEGLQATWTSRNDIIQLYRVPTAPLKQTVEVNAWKGERTHAKALLYSKSDEGELRVRMAPWAKNGTATTMVAEARFMKYVITDDFKACGNHNFNLKPWLAPDIIDQDRANAVPAMEVRPIWCTFDVPHTAEAGTYTAQLEVVNAAGTVVKTLNATLHINERALPTPNNQTFHLDLWQQPYSVSRYYGVERWSEAHLAALKPYLKALARAGQSVVSTILFYEPWGEQTHDKFSPMVQVTKKANGTWEYDYTVFDKYVNLCDECGINKQINCFSMVPWDMKFRYFDEAQGKNVDLATSTDRPEYKELWDNFLRQFKAHLIEKGWFEKTCIAMDERAENVMLQAYNIAQVHGFKMALAGNYHASLADKLYDYCVALHQVQGRMSNALAQRKAKGQVSTFYVSCAEAEPNIFTNSYPAEATYLPLYAAANELDGFLHWSWINWDEHPLTDSRFRKFGSGDTYCYYPGNRSSVRFERLIEGIHQYEKIQVLKKEYAAQPDKLAQLNLLLSLFANSHIQGAECGNLVDKMEDFLNGKEVEMPALQQLTDGYYRLVSKATTRSPYLYNNALQPANQHELTFQTKTPVETNNGIWKVTVQAANRIAIQNGDGLPLVAGKSNAAGVEGRFSTLHIGDRELVGGRTYYYFTEAINCTNGGRNFKIGNDEFITTWVNGGSAPADNRWELQPIELNGRKVYTVAVDSEEKAYVTFSHDGKQEYAFHHGFFLANDLQLSDLSVAVRNQVVESYAIRIVNDTIKVSDIKLLPAPVRQTLFDTKNSGGNYPYRIPAISKTPSGRLIAVASRLVCGTDPGYGPVDLVCRTSDDNGQTWSAIKDIAVGTGVTSATVNYLETAFGDPALVANRTSQEVALLAVAGCTVYGLSTTNRQNPNKIALIRSHDNGNTWGTPIDLTEQIYSLFDSGKVVQAAFVGAGKLFQSRIIKKGNYYRVYAALCARPGGNRVIYSDDFCQTWQALGGPNALPVPSGDEPKCEELPDGRVIVSSRTSGGRFYNIFSYTNTLEAKGDWETVVKSTFEGSQKSPGTNSTNGEIIVLPVVRKSDQKEVYLALQSLPTGAGSGVNARSHVGIFYKELDNHLNDLRTVKQFSTGWDGYFPVSQTTSAYSSIDVQEDGKLAFFFEETYTYFGKKPNPSPTTNQYNGTTHNNDGYDCVYLPLSVEHITGNKYTLSSELNRKKFLTDYFLALKAEATQLTAAQQAEVDKAIAAMSEAPTPEQIDRVYAALKGVIIGIHLVENEQKEARSLIYNLGGQRLSHSPKGVHIVGKQKVVQ